MTLTSTTQHRPKHPRRSHPNPKRSVHREQDFVPAHKYRSNSRSAGQKFFIARIAADRSRQQTILPHLGPNGSAGCSVVHAPITNDPPPLLGRACAADLPRVAPSKRRLHPWLQACAPSGRSENQVGSFCWHFCWRFLVAHFSDAGVVLKESSSALPGGRLLEAVSGG